MKEGHLRETALAKAWNQQRGSEEEMARRWRNQALTSYGSVLGTRLSSRYGSEALERGCSMWTTPATGSSLTLNCGASTHLSSPLPQRSHPPSPPHHRLCVGSSPPLPRILFPTMHRGPSSKYQSPVMRNVGGNTP